MKKKIIIILNEAPLPFLGAACRWYYTLINELLKRRDDFDVVLFSSCKKEEDVVEAKKLFPNGYFYLYPKREGVCSKLETILRPYSYTIPKELKEDLKKEILKGYDVIHVEQTFASWALEKTYPKMLLSVHYLANIDLMKVRSKSLKERMTFFLMKKTEKKLISRFHHIKSCTDRIENELRNWFPNKDYVNFPFGIQKENYFFLPTKERERSDYITLIATMTWYPGLSAAKRLIEEIYPELRKKNPEIKLRIVGWGAISALSSYLNMDGLEVFENVKDIREYFYRTALLVYAPDVGTGVKIKIQEAMLFGTPVVTNTEGAEGLGLIHEKHALIGNSNQEIIFLIERLFNDLNLQEKLRIQARKHIEETCDGKIVIDKMIATYNKIILQEK